MKTETELNQAVTDLVQAGAAFITAKDLKDLELQFSQKLDHYTTTLNNRVADLLEYVGKLERRIEDFNRRSPHSV